MSDNLPTSPIPPTPQDDYTDMTPAEEKVADEYTDASNPYAVEKPVDPAQSKRNMTIAVIIGIAIIVAAIIVGIVIYNVAIVG